LYVIVITKHIAFLQVYIGIRQGIKSSLIHWWFIIYWSLSVVLHSIAIVGDITPSCGVPKAEKSRREQEALNKMCELLGGGMRGFINYYSWNFLQRFQIWHQIYWRSLLTYYSWRDKRTLGRVWKQFFFRSQSCEGFWQGTNMLPSTEVPFIFEPGYANKNRHGFTLWDIWQ